MYPVSYSPTSNAFREAIFAGNGYIMDRPTLHRIVLLFAVLAISAVFFAMIHGFIMVILLAGLFAALTHPLYRRIERGCKGRRTLASFATLLLLLLVILIPFGVLFGVVAQQAFRISRSVQPWVEDMIRRPSAFDDILRALPFRDSLSAYKEVILQKGGELVGIMSNLLFRGISSATLSTVNFFFLFFLFLYMMFFFLRDGPTILNKMLYYLPLSERSEHRLLDKFTSVARATIKGTFLIGIIQGTLAGLAFWIIGIESALFWGTVMTVLSVIPGVGTAFVWVPAVIILAVTGHLGKAIGLLLYCALLVGSVDNLLRPKFVGKDTRMPEFLIFLGTIGGISFFGIAGFLIGPIVAALFVTVWEIYGETFREYLSG
jgi:predicted PurR-regulated permease PerM